MSYYGILNILKSELEATDLVTTVGQIVRPGTYPYSSTMTGQHTNRHGDLWLTIKTIVRYMLSSNVSLKQFLLFLSMFIK